MSATAQGGSAKLVAGGQAVAGDVFAMMGIEVRVKVTGAETGGAYSQIEQVVQPGKGSPPHVMQEDKVIYVVEGSFDVRLGDEVVRAEAGASAIIPRGTVHNFRNAGATRGTVLVTISPAGHEDFMRDLAALVQDGPADRDAMVATAARHGVTLLLG